MAKFVPRQRKHKARQRCTESAPSVDSNAAELLPASKAEKDERRQHLRQELLARNLVSKASGKKRKRLDRYIDSKLKKEENTDLIRKLSKQKVDTSLLRSSRKLGRGNDTNREALSRALQQTRAGIDQGSNKRILFVKKSNRDDDALDSDSASIASEASQRSEQRLPPQSYSTNASSFGTGLKRPLEVDDAGNPLIQTRKRLKKELKTIADSESGESDWEGFSSGSQSHNDELASDVEGSQTSRTGSEDISNDDSEEDEGSTSSSYGDALEDERKDGDATKRQSAFKAWATQQRNQAAGFTPSAATENFNEHQGLSSGQFRNYPHNGDRSPSFNAQIRQVQELKPQDIKHTTFHVPVTRSLNVEEARSKLPVVAEEQTIMETIRHNDCAIICGDTGSGKTTQVPQFLFEAGYGCPNGPTPGLIGVTQPRRVAAVSMAKRVSCELGSIGEKVSYQVRFDSSVGSKTALKFMSDGVLLREVSQNFLLSKYSVIVIDEAHERSVNTDILIGMLSRIVETRRNLAVKNSKHKPLKLIIMSATLRITDFTLNSTLFRNGPPPIVQAEGRQYDVTVHFSKKTRRDYVDEAYEKIKRGHRKLPPGGMLVFLTGQNEIDQVARSLKETFSCTSTTTNSNAKMRVSATEAAVENEDVELGQGRHDRESSSESDVSIRGVDSEKKADREDDEFDIGDEDGPNQQQVHVLPLYSQLPTEQQMRVFEAPPPNSRLIVLATNVAETSLTIPGIRYVFDCGRAKDKQYNSTTGVQSFAIDWISKANASQRAGRAGRTGPGHCYRLYSSAVYERDFAEHPIPEIQRTPVEGVVLQLKSMGIPNVDHFPFPSPPNRQSLMKAERLLEHLGAISDGKVTPIGKQLSLYPLSPRPSRILTIAQSYDCLNHAIALVAVLVVPEIFVQEAQLDVTDHDSGNESGGQKASLRESRRKDFGQFHGNAARLDRHSDAIKLLTTLCDFSNSTTPMEKFTTHTRVKALNEALQLRQQLRNLVAAQQPGFLKPDMTNNILLPSSAQVKVLRHLVAAGYIDQIAQRADLSPSPPQQHRKSSRATHMPYITLFRSRSDEARTNSKRADDPESNYVYIHPSSVLAHTPKANLPQFVIYSHLSQAPPSTIERDSGGTTELTQPRIRMHPLVPVSSAQIVSIAKNTPLLGEGKPVGKIETLERSAENEERRACWMVPFLKGEAGGAEWPLPPARRVVQKRVPGKGWVNEDRIAE